MDEEAYPQLFNSFCGKEKPHGFSMNEWVMFT